MVLNRHHQVTLLVRVVGEEYLAQDKLVGKAVRVALTEVVVLVEMLLVLYDKQLVLRPIQVRVVEVVVKDQVIHLEMAVVGVVADVLLDGVQNNTQMLQV
jgi:hypothetical protein